jgi:hypothetical protein
MASERFSHRIDTWMTADDAAFVVRLAEAEATSESGAIRKLIRLARIQVGAYPQPAQPAE